MANSRAQRPRTIPQIANAASDPDRATSAAIDQLTTEVARIGGLAVLSRQVIVTALVVGVNRINHGLRRPVRGYTLTPSVADASFAHALTTAGNTDPRTCLLITVVGVAQPTATLEVY